MPHSIDLSPWLTRVRDRTLNNMSKSGGSIHSSVASIWSISIFCEGYHRKIAQRDRRVAFFNFSDIEKAVFKDHVWCIIDIVMKIILKIGIKLYMHDPNIGVRAGMSNYTHKNNGCDHLFKLKSQLITVNTKGLWQLRTRNLLSIAYFCVTPKQVKFHDQWCITDFQPCFVNNKLRVNLLEGIYWNRMENMKKR